MLIAFMSLLVNQVNAQEYIVIKLHDLTKFKGRILSSFDSTGVLLSIEGNPLLVKYDQIRTIRFKSSSKPYDQGKRNGRDEFAQFEKGYYHSIAIGLISGNDNSDISATIVNGYKFHRFLHAGIGVNYDRYENMSAIPIFLEGKGYVKKGKFVPYYFAQLGYGFTVEDRQNNYYAEYDSKGGFYWKFGVGYQINFYKTAMAFSVGYGNQKTRSEYVTNYYQPWLSSYYYGDPIEVSEKRSMRRVDVKISLLF